jgi:hypothetical protein
MKEKFAAWISAHRRVAVAAAVIFALAAFVLYRTVEDVLSKPRLPEGTEVVLLDTGSVKDNSVCIIAGDPEERNSENVLLVGEWTGGTVLADEGSIWAVDRLVKVRLEGPEVLGKGYREGKPFWVKLGPDRMVVWVYRSNLERLSKALAR